jgi:hypothetical protein
MTEMQSESLHASRVSRFPPWVLANPLPTPCVISEIACVIAASGSMEMLITELHFGQRCAIPFSVVSASSSSMELLFTRVIGSPHFEQFPVITPPLGFTHKKICCWPSQHSPDQGCSAALGSSGGASHGKPRVSLASFGNSLEGKTIVPIVLEENNEGRRRLRRGAGCLCLAITDTGFSHTHSHAGTFACKLGGVISQLKVAFYPRET